MNLKERKQLLISEMFFRKGHAENIEIHQAKPRSREMFPDTGGERPPLKKRPPLKNFPTDQPRMNDEELQALRTGLLTSKSSIQSYPHESRP